MSNRKKYARAVELGKDVLIVLLTCSALWLLARGQVLGRLGGLLQEEDPWTGTGQGTIEARADAARPLSLAANLFQDGTKTARYGVQYNGAAGDALFQQVAGLLVEALSSAGAPERIDRAQWERSLSTAPGVTLDFGGALPMPVLTGWLAGEGAALDAAVRRLTLTVWGEKVALYYRDEGDGQYYRCLSEVASQLHLTEALSALGENGARYAFELEEYSLLDPDTLILAAPPTPEIYSASNPMGGGRTSLEELMEQLGISVDASNFYPSGIEQVARSGSESLRLSERGTAVYETGETEEDRFPVQARQGEPDLYESVEACRRLAADTVGTRCGDARLYLISARRSGERLEVRFGYSLNGAVVRLEQGDAARFWVEKGRVVRFELNFRSYTGSGQTTVVMPLRQAVAALDALDLAGEELLLVYGDAGGDMVFPTWAAAGNRLTEGG